MASSDFEKHPSALRPTIIVFNLIVAILGAIIGIQLIVTLGITPNTSIIGALIAMILSRIPVRFFKQFRSLHEQNLVQTSISSATFGAGNSLLIPIGIPFVMGTPELILPMLLGASLAMISDATILFKVFDSKLFPAKGAWPPGVATAEALIAGDQGGKRAGLLGIGTGLGLLGSYFGISMSAFGVAFIGNIWALTMFGVGLLLRGYSKPLFGFDINSLYVPHGFMIGAGIVALIQVILIVRKKQEAQKADAHGEVLENLTRTEKDISQAFTYGFIAYLAIALIIALTTGIITKMSFGMLIVYLVFAAFAAFVHEIIVGISAMHSGWFPAFAVALITLIIGMLIGFPPVALALMVGFSASTGPAFADMGYDLKTGYRIRGDGSNPELEKDGRKQQYITAILAFVVAIIVVFFSHKGYFAANLVPPVDRVYVATIKAGASAEVARNLLLWAIPGAILQFVGGPNRQMGILLATGLLIINPKAGWAVLAGIAIRAIVLKVKGKEAETPMSIMAAGFIAGDALYSFFSSVFTMRTKK
ncbi:OPT/YSL family transporter [Desulfosporosinus metallidurans]|uniref:OPT family oligopeptide transporter n=1 Tax=Desulfosporosinus metallidurans TaxID=1888891 RepID=A0A1Q8QXB6_9FIRM|nr:OPT/YSL family transporter [Desulfosporosinus metallidurans]OLN31984.1 Hypothetical protein DSOL_2077 [Desulfosporosinus metallidurans]